jgi:hypothetical protein
VDCSSALAALAIARLKQAARSLLIFKRRYLLSDSVLLGKANFPVAAPLKKAFQLHFDRGYEQGQRGKMGRLVIRPSSFVLRRSSPTDYRPPFAAQMYSFRFDRSPVGFLLPAHSIAWRELPLFSLAGRLRLRNFFAAAPSLISVPRLCGVLWETVQQRRVDRVVANVYFFFVAEGDWLEPVKRFASAIHGFDIILVTSRGAQVIK